MTPEQDMENNAVLAENYARVLAEKIDRLIAHVDTNTPATDTTRDATRGIFAAARPALARLEAALVARDARKTKGRKAA